MKTSFPEILNTSKLVIPIIQRDYAQGRLDNKTNRIRKDFLDALFGVLQRRINGETDNQTLELDFVYGFNKQDNSKPIFSPIDGQQRLTTLWLLWWFVAAKERVSEKAFLFNFRYETRHSTTVFCEKLLEFEPAFKLENIANEIKNQSWYFETWDYDPGISAMLVMLNDIEQRYANLGDQSVWPLLNNSNSPFCFYKLDMEKVGLPDDLYIKMNSRGRPLTEFEYFKASFSEIITDPVHRERFDNSIDQEWVETIWQIVSRKNKGNKLTDLALTVDSCFIRLLNFITDVIAYKQGIQFTDISSTPAAVKHVYQQEENQLFLFGILDKIAHLKNDNASFWDKLFYVEKSESSPNKTRLFFQNSQINLLEKCLFSYTKNGREFPFPEQILLYACIIHWMHGTTSFGRISRVVRNLVANSSNELRVESIGESFKEIESFVQSGNFEELIHFKTDQIKEEKDKSEYLLLNTDVVPHVFELEDSDLMRGCISIFSLDEQFISRKKSFLTIFDEDLVFADFINRANLLLCFGDYSQDDGIYTNMLAKSKANWRTFFTTPAFNKTQLNLKTKEVLMKCLDFFTQHPEILPSQKIIETLHSYETGPKDWKYYFLKYPEFREGANKGYYYWEEHNSYPLFKMKEKQKNGYHWDPFLSEIKRMAGEEGFELYNGGGMSIFVENNLLTIESEPDGFLISAGNDDTDNNMVLDILINAEVLPPGGKLIVEQNDEGIDMEDRIEKAVELIKKLKEFEVKK